MTSEATYTVIYARDKRGREIAYLEETATGKRHRIPMTHADSMRILTDTPFRYER